MAKRKKDTMEFRFYELPQGESALVLCGESWKRVYGHEEFHLHFHNLLEIGICREGDGNMYLDEDIYQYHDGDITFIPENFPHVTVSYGEVVNFWEYIFIDIHSVIEEMFPNNAAFQNEAVTTISKKAFMTNVYQSPAISTPFLIMMFRQNSRNFPIDIMEAARIDGLSEIGIFFKMYMPVQKSTYAAAAVITFMNAWNSYLWPKVILNKPAAITMPMLIANLAAGYTVDYGVLMMGVLFCSIPTMLVFFVLQKQFAEGITGSVK